MERPVHLLTELLRGESLERHRVAELLGVQPAAADRHLKAISKLPGVRKARVGGKTLFTYERKEEPPELASVVAAGLAASFARLFEGSAYMEGMRRVRDGLISVAPRRHRFRHVDKKLFFLLQGGEEAIGREDNALEEVVEAVLEEKKLRLYYEHFDGAKERTTVHPLSLMVYRQQLYLLALTAKGEAHPYRVARVLSAEVGKRFEYPTSFDPNETFRDAFGVFVPAGPAELVRVRLTPRWSTFVRTHRWHPSQVVEADGVTVRILVRPCAEVEQWVLGFGEEAEVLEPAALRAQIRKRLQQLVVRYADLADVR